MKTQLFAIMLVLGLPSVASATYSAVAPVVAGIVTWDVTADQLVGTGTAFGIYDGYLMSITNGTLTADPLSDGTMPGVWFDAGWGSYVTQVGAVWATYAQDVSPDPPPMRLGKWFSFNISGFTNPMTIDIWGSATGSSGTITIIPEPMTIALLGLGGLFLLRRRK